MSLHVTSYRWTHGITLTVTGAVIGSGMSFEITPLLATVTTPTQTATDDAIVNSTSSILTPGTAVFGEWSATSQPATQGNATQNGYTATAIARWDVVPYQTFDDELTVGVVAFHIAGIDHVAFSVNDGPWSNITTMTYNPQTSVVEYWATLRASDFATDGPVEVRAIVYPKAGVARVLEGITEYVNAQGTLSQQIVWVATTGNDDTGDGSEGNPYASILFTAQLWTEPQKAASGTTIYLKAGTYQHRLQPGWLTPNVNDRWITVTAAPGVARSAVIIQPLGRMTEVQHLAFSNVTIQAVVGSDLQSTNADYLWLDNVDITQVGGTSGTLMNGSIIAPGFANIYVTNSSLHDYTGKAFIGATLLRNVQINRIGDWPICDPCLAVNVTVDTVLEVISGEHYDGIFWIGDGDMNSIVYNVKMTNIFGLMLNLSHNGGDNGYMANVAVVNFLATDSESTLVQQGGSSIFGDTDTFDHFLLWNITLPNQTILIYDGYGAVTNSEVNGVVAWRVGATVGIVPIVNSHFIDGTGIPGHGNSIGDPGFVTAPDTDGTYSPTGDFHLTPTSILLNRLAVPLVPIDVDGLVRTTPSSIGAYE